MVPLEIAAWVQDAVGGSMIVALPVALLAGMVSFFSPCVVPLLPGRMMLRRSSANAGGPASSTVSGSTVTAMRLLDDW